LEGDDITEQHCKAFMLKEFSQSTLIKYDKPQSKSASMAVCCPKIERDYIKHVVMNGTRALRFTICRMVKRRIGC
jgi:hypothetical protein